MRIRYLIGIDEAGRGPLAGPVSVAAVLIPAAFNEFFFQGIRDSKKLSPKMRDLWYAKLLKREGGLLWSASFSSHRIIDRKGITKAVSQALERCLSAFPVDPGECRVFLDAGLRAPQAFVRQESIIRGDEQVPLIAAASIIAKVRRDRHMTALARRFPQYGFEVHKGYGTRAHQEALREHGLSEIHRTTFCKV